MESKSGVVYRSIVRCHSTRFVLISVSKMRLGTTSRFFGQVLVVVESAISTSHHYVIQSRNFFNEHRDFGFTSPPSLILSDQG